MSKNSNVKFKYYLKITILIQNLISIIQIFIRKISKNFYINLLDHRGSNPERKDQNLACYHYTMIQFIKNPVLFFYNVHLSANPCSTCGGSLYPDFQIPMEIINPSYIVLLYLYKLSLHNIHYASTFNLLTTCGFIFLSSKFQRTNYNIKIVNALKNSIFN